MRDGEEGDMEGGEEREGDPTCAYTGTWSNE